jgi:hypothetical protein
MLYFLHGLYSCCSDWSLRVLGLLVAEYGCMQGSFDSHPRARGAYSTGIKRQKQQYPLNKINRPQTIYVTSRGIGSHFRRNTFTMQAPSGNWSLSPHLEEPKVPSSDGYETEERGARPRVPPGTPRVFGAGTHYDLRYGTL